MSDTLELRRCRATHHQALHAAAEFQPGEVLQEFGARAVLDEPNYLTVQVRGVVCWFAGLQQMNGAEPRAAANAPVVRRGAAGRKQRRRWERPRPSR